jgi:hypothetical protein
LGQLDAQTRLQVANLDAATRLELGNLDANTRLQLGALDSNTRLQLGTLDSQTRLQLGQLDSSTRLQVASMDNTTRIQLSNIDGTYKQLLQTNQSAANLYDQALTSIASINMSSLSPEAKTSAINFQTATLRDGLNALQNVGNLNYVTSGNIDFGNNATLVFGDTLDANNGGGTTGGGTTSGGGPSYTGSSGTGNSSTIGSGRWALENNTVYSPGGDPLPGYYVDFQGTVFDYNGLPVGNLNDPQMMV